MRTLFVDYSDPLELGRAHLVYLRYMGLLLPCPARLSIFETVAVGCKLPGGMNVTLRATVVTDFGLNVYGLQILPDSHVRKLLVFSRECAARYQARMLEAGNHYDAKAGPLVQAGSNPEEDTVPEGKDFIDDLTPVEVVLAESAQRFERWLVERGADMDLRLARSQERAARSQSENGRDSEGRFDTDSPTALEKRLWALSTAEKKKLAVSGGSVEREILFRDCDLSIQVWVLKNPDVSEAEVIRFSRASPMAPDAMQLLLTTRKWGLCREVVRVLVMNPSTPGEAVGRLLSVLSTPELKELARSSDSSDLVKSTAQETVNLRDEAV